jgi:hypothetical protein
MSARLIRLPLQPQPRDVQAAVANFKHITRNDSDIFGVAYVLCFRNGSIGHIVAGGDSGAQHQLAAGSLLIQNRIMQGYEM